MSRFQVTMQYVVHKPRKSHVFSEMTDSLADTCEHLVPNENQAVECSISHRYERIWKGNYTKKANVIVVFVVGPREGGQNSWVFDLFFFYLYTIT